jgi:hypothetical protein
LVNPHPDLRADFPGLAPKPGQGAPSVGRPTASAFKLMTLCHFMLYWCGICSCNAD